MKTVKYYIDEALFSKNTKIIKLTGYEKTLVYYLGNLSYEQKNAIKTFKDKFCETSNIENEFEQRDIKFIKMDLVLMMLIFASCLVLDNAYDQWPNIGSYKYTKYCEDHHKTPHNPYDSALGTFEYEGKWGGPLDCIVRWLGKSKENENYLKQFYNIVKEHKDKLQDPDAIYDLYFNEKTGIYNTTKDIKDEVN